MRDPQWGGRRAQAARATIAAQLPTPCTKCGNPVHPWMAWDLDHIHDRATHPHLTWNPNNWGAAHAHCNRRAGATQGNRARNNGQPKTARGW